MIGILDENLRNRVSNAIVNIRLIASRVKRANLEDAMQRCGVVVLSLDGFRKYVSVNVGKSYTVDTSGTFKHNVATRTQTVEALQQADIIYKMLTKQKQASYKEEIKQVKILFVDVIEYLESILKELE